MKKIVALTLFPTLVLVALWGVNSCSKIDKNSINTSVNTNIYLAPIKITFINADPTSPNQLQDTTDKYRFICSITGPGAPSVVATDGSNVISSNLQASSFSTSHGILTLALQTSANPSTTNPVVFNINGTLNGFAPINASVAITSKSATEVVVKVLELARPVAGTAVTPTVNSSLANGIANTAIVINTSSNTNVVPATITIPTGTQVFNGTGAAINASSLTTNVIQYSTPTATAEGAFPGGLQPKNVVDKAGVAINGGVNLRPLGALSINMSANGADVKSFSGNGIKLSMPVPSSTINPTTGSLVKVGDSIPVWSLNETTGLLTYEGVAPITNNGSGSLVANYNATHLTAWLYSWYTVPSGSNSTTFKFTANTGVNDGTYYFKVLDASGSVLQDFTSFNISNGVRVVVTSVTLPSNFNVLVYANNSNGSSPLATISATSPTAQNSTVTLSFNPPSSGETIKVKMNLAGKCSNNSTTINVGTWVNFQAFGSSYIQSSYVTTLNNVNVSDYNNPISLLTGKHYHVGIYYGGNWVGNTIDVSSIAYYKTHTSPKFDDITGSQGGTNYGLTGTTSYDESTNTLTINATFNTTCN